MRGMFSVYDEPGSPNEGLRLRYVMNRCCQMGGWGGVFKIYHDPESLNDGGMFKMYDEPDSPNEGAACLRYMANGNRHMRGRV